MSEGFTIRPVRPGDAEAVWALVRELAEYEKLEHVIAGSPEALDSALFRQDGPRLEVLIAEVQGEPAGFAAFFENYATFSGKPSLYLEDIFVPPRFRHQGIGTALLARVAQAAVDRGCARMDWLVQEWNDQAIAFYMALGARPQNEMRPMRLSGEAIEALARKESLPPGSA